MSFWDDGQGEISVAETSDGSGSWPAFRDAGFPSSGHRPLPAAFPEFARHYHRPAILDEKPTRAILSSAQLGRIRSFIEQAQCQRVTISAIAELCGISTSHMRRLFKETTGMSLGSYVEMVRIIRAKSLLGEGRLPLKQIAYELGFANPSAFSAAFRRATGATPKAYRLAYRG